ncbi:MAG: type II secretion system protein [Planctomycetota bacterium]|nr:type II secretion system protein [Planctomycetota bacterium]
MRSTKFIVSQMASNRSRSRGALGFTLVEILTVVAIIAVLVAILLPALMTARRNALWAQSQNNLKQCVTYLQAYTTANRDFIPPSTFDYTMNHQKGNVRAPEVTNNGSVNPPLGNPYTGTWADILWADSGLGGVAVQLPTGEQYNWKKDSPDRLLYDAYPAFNNNPFRSAVELTTPFVEDDVTITDEATPFGIGAATREAGHPGYFAANDFFNATGPTGRWFTTAQIRRPVQSIWLVDSRAGETIAFDEATWGGHDGQTDHRYVGDMMLAALLDGHIESIDHFDSLEELQGAYYDDVAGQTAGTDYVGYGWKVTNLDRSDNPDPTP